MSAILQRIREVSVQYKINMTEYERDTEQIRIVQDSERYAIYVSGTKIKFFSCMEDERQQKFFQKLVPPPHTCPTFSN